jgi:hypothetical protein
MKIDMDKIHKARLVQEVEKHAGDFSGQFDLNGPIGKTAIQKSESPFFIPVKYP